MTDFADMDDTLRSMNDKVEVKKKFLIFSSLLYRPTQEKISTGGGRYFDCPMSDLLPLFEADDYEGISRLSFALDEDGEPDTSGVELDFGYTASGSFIAVQPVEYVDSCPTPQAPVRVFEGDQAKALFPMIKKLEQMK